MSCSGITDFPPQVELSWLAAGKCTNDEDHGVWESKGKAAFSSDMNACGHSSLGNKGLATKCMAGKEGYSSDCAGCFGDTISCTASKCLSKCIGGQSPACTQCVKDNCDSDLLSCSGITDFPPQVELSWLLGAGSASIYKVPLEKRARVTLKEKLAWAERVSSSEGTPPHDIVISDFQDVCPPIIKFANE